MTGTPESSPVAAGAPAVAAAFAPLRLVRIAVTGLFMGIANLIPGVSGGTMVLALGFYREFVDTVADLTALRFTTRRLSFIGVLGCCAAGAIVAFAGVLLYLLFHYPVAMYALFIGLTLGGAPALARALRPWRVDAVLATAVGLALMLGVLGLRQGAGFPHNTVMDFISGVVGAMTMVLPGVSGSYVLLVMDQYERIMDAIRPLQPRILVPVALGAALGIVGLSHLLKLLLARCARPTLGVLLGILLGSVLGLWPFDKVPGEKAMHRRTPAELRAFAETWQLPGVAGVADDQLVATILRQWPQRQQSSYTPGRILGAAALVLVGFGVTWGLTRLRSQADDGLTAVAPLPAPAPSAD
ncbi:MAG: DUF368 domain-containing protein [Phycisphaerales bacterium]|nr:DUF368 domain-containing protein [Phycisphaerales bacterium]